MSTETTTQAECEAIRRTLAGELQAFALITDRYQGAVYRCAYAVTRDHEDADDATQEAFLRLYRNLSQFDPRRPLKPYLMTIAVNCARSRLRQRRSNPAAGVTDEVLAQIPDPAPAPAGTFLQHERRREIRRLLGDLPAMLRDVCILFYLDGLSCRETAGALNTSEGAVKTALHRARVRLLDSPLREWLST
ncbi:MAG: sigma-70 family RNA polymerase sigma factor [Lentisphaeria bacterium]|nr:sigma-70 family RNA polymerase sigma factor [Lentisphaeria bacterium]